MGVGFGRVYLICFAQRSTPHLPYLFLFAWWSRQIQVTSLTASLFAWSSIYIWNEHFDAPKPMQQSLHTNTGSTRLAAQPSPTSSIIHVWKTTQTMIFSVASYLELHVPISFYYECIFLPVKMLMFYSVQTTNSRRVGKKMRRIVDILCTPNSRSR